MSERSGVLRPVVEAFLNGQALSAEQAAVMRAYLRQWIMAGIWSGPEIETLRRDIDGLTDREAIADWLDRAVGIGIDPL